MRERIMFRKRDEPGPLTVPPGMPHGPWRNGIGQNDFGPLTVPPGMPHGPYDIGLGQKPMTEKDIIVSMRSTYVKTANDIASVMEETNKSLSSYLTKYQKYRSEFGKTIRTNIQRKLIGIGISPFAAIGAVVAGVQLASKIESETRALENTKKIYTAVSDTLKNVTASWRMFKELRFMDLMAAGIVKGESVLALAKNLGQPFEWVHTRSLLTVINLWASKRGVSWNAETFPAGARVTSAERAILSNLRTLGAGLKIPEDKKIFTREWTVEQGELVVEYRVTFMAAARKAYEKALEEGKREVGMPELVFNWIVEKAKSLLNLALFAVAGLPGILAHFMGFRLIQFTDMTKAAYAAARILPAALTTIGEGTTAFSKTYKKVRIDEKKSDAEAKTEAVDAAEKKIEEVGVPAFKAARADIDRYMNHYKAVEAAYGKFMEEVKGILGKILLYGGIALGVVVVGGVIAFRALGPVAVTTPAGIRIKKG